VTQTAEHHHPAGDPAIHPAPAAYHADSVTYLARPPGRFARFLARIWARSPRWLAPAAILACFGSAVAYVLAREPIDGAADQTTCLLKFTTGYDCPGCGGTRAFFFLIQGNLPAAARHHLVFVFAVPFLAYLYAAWAGNLVFGWKLPQLRPGPGLVGILVSSLAAFTVLRNLPWAPFTWFYV
jgi:hypothetical protein